MFNKFSCKLQELEGVNYQLKSLLVNNEKENEEYKLIIKDLNLNLLNSNEIIRKTKDYFNGLLLEKDRRISLLNEQIASMKDNLDTNDKKMTVLLTEQNMKTIENEEFLRGIENTKNDLDNLKERLYQKYMGVKKRNDDLLIQLKEKENAITILLNKCDSKEHEKVQNHEKYQLELNKQRENSNYLIAEKEKMIKEFSKYKAIIGDELKILRQMISHNGTNLTSSTNNKIFQNMNYFHEIKKDYQVFDGTDEIRISDSISKINNVLEKMRDS